ncbi:GyrI-like domain-containing protein [Paenibacillus tyrfis]|uniref:GyrI-like domain-containing protein n=1 Tax=Paenibacillus tyrfis TaxID=1501230 RepID=UPI0020A0EAB8|nr:GyrI-like domain-containing protein [Paenibacillus tyrfis]MCP1307335.1 GyrI-like domain-containing protein [Paenibacillus tyrfis]
MKTTIIQKPSFMVVGVSLETLLQDEREQRNIPKLHQKFNERIAEITNRINDNAIGIFIDPPNYSYKLDKFKWIAGVEVTGMDELPEGMEAVSFPANTYACVTYKGKKNQAYQAYDYLYQWVAESEYELADTYGVEHYKEYDEETAEEIMDLMFPVKKK